MKRHVRQNRLMLLRCAAVDGPRPSLQPARPQATPVVAQPLSLLPRMVSRWTGSLALSCQLISDVQTSLSPHIISRRLCVPSHMLASAKHYVSVAGKGGKMCPSHAFKTTLVINLCGTNTLNSTCRFNMALAEKYSERIRSLILDQPYKKSRSLH